MIIVWQLVISRCIHLALTGIGYAWQTAEALREARDRVARAEVLRARAELELLRSQLHPHFVLNVLHALLGLVRRDPALAEQALERLGELLRFGQWVQQTGSDWVPLSREWAFVQSYLELERMRLGPRLRVEVDADASALEVAVPPFALQPLVENAIVHAVAPRAAGGRVEVSARRSGGRLLAGRARRRSRSLRSGHRRRARGWACGCCRSASRPSTRDARSRVRVARGGRVPRPPRAAGRFEGMPEVA